MLPHIRSHEYPGQSLAIEVYREAGIRSCEIGTVMHGESHSGSSEDVPSRMELVRLAIPHRVYTQSHIDYVIEAILQVHKRRESICGYRITTQPKFLRHFSARFEPLRTDSTGSSVPFHSNRRSTELINAASRVGPEQVK